MAITSVERQLTEGPGQGLIRNLDPRHLPPRAWSQGRNVRFYRNATRLRKIDGYFLHDTTPDGEAVRLLWHYMKSDGTEHLVRVGTTKAWTGVGAGRVEIASALGGSAAAVVTADQFKDDLIWTDGVAPVKRYSGGGGGSVVSLPGFTLNRSKIVLEHKQHLHHFNVIENGVPKPWRDVYSGIGDPTDYVSDTAGDLDFLETAGGITAAGILGERIIVHKGENPVGSMHAMVFTGAPDKYVQEPIPADDAAISQRALARWGAFQFYMGHNNFYRLGAFPEPIGDAIWPEIIAEMGNQALLDYAQRERIFAFVRPEWREIGWKIPRVGASQPDLTALYNTRDGTWTLTDHDPALCVALFPSLITDTWDVGTPGPWDLSPDVPWDYAAYSQALPLTLFGQLDGSVHQYGGVNANGQPIVWFVESPVFFHDLRPGNFLELPILARGTGILNVQHRAWMSERQPPTGWPAASPFLLEAPAAPGGETALDSKEWADVRSRGRFWQVRFSQDGLGADCELSAYGPGVVPGGSVR